ncbi:MAG: tryptophan-rich sensory protein [Ruminococcaceae bacterium]|nr:tryptophan-rich sensory protein [Oscillospiraceae bacterium]
MKKKFDTKNLITLIVCILIPLTVGGLAALLTKNSMDVYQTINKPPLAPPGILFPIVWTILYTLMGVSLYLVYKSNSPYRPAALLAFALQLIFNFVWSLLFFNGRMYTFAFIWLLVLWLLIILMIVEFKKVKPIAAWLQIPYLLWVTFAAYLNLSIAIMN